ncbi:GNAT family N-acetyltransferase [Thermaurantiacus sp.]
MGDAFAAAAFTGPADAPALFAMMAAHHPVAPHWHLPFIRVDPAAQGGGLGAMLLDFALARIDAQGLPAHLESSNPRHIPRDKRAGFGAVGEIQVGESPRMIAMWRPAR